MSVDLATQIRDYAREVHLDERPLTLDEITALRLSAEPVRPIGLKPRDDPAVGCGDGPGHGHARRTHLLRVERRLQPRRHAPGLRQL